MTPRSPTPGLSPLPTETRSLSRRPSSNTGSITLAGGASLVLDTTFTLAGLGNVTNSGGAIYVEGTLDNAGSTLNGSSGLGRAVLYGGTVQGGTATPSGLILSGYGGTLSGVTYDGTLDLSNACVHLADGTVVDNAEGDGAGTINDNCGTLIFDNTQTFNNATINLAGALYEDDTSGAGTVLTLGSGVVIDQTGDAYIYTGDYSSDGIVNQGAINRSGTSSYLFIYGNGCLHQHGRDHGRFERWRAGHRHHHVHQLGGLSTSPTATP